MVPHYSVLFLAIFHAYLQGLHTAAVIVEAPVGIRQKRLAAKLIVPAKWVVDQFLAGSHTYSFSMWATKPAGFRTAISEFKSFSPTNIKRIPEGNGVEGVIGDLRVSVLRSGPNGVDAVVIIKMNKTLEPVKTIFYERLY